MKKKNFKYYFMLVIVILCYTISAICLLVSFIIQINLQMETYGVYVASIHIWSWWDMLDLIAILFISLPMILTRKH